MLHHPDQRPLATSEIDRHVSPGETMNIIVSANARQSVALADIVRVRRSDRDRTLVGVGLRDLVLTGPVFNDILPLLDGTRAPHEVVTSLSDRHETLDVWLAIELLRKHKLLRSADQSPVSPLGDLAMEKIDVPTPYHFYRGRVIHPNPEVSTIHVGGFGETEDEAMARCRGEATERWSGFLQDNVDSIRARKGDLEGPAYDPAELLNFSKNQFKARRHLNRTNCEFDFIPRPFDRDTAIDWSPARILSTNEKCWLPTALVYYASHPIAGSEFGVADLNGCAAGPNFEQACLSGLLELIERDACAIWWYNQIVPPTINTRAFCDDALTELINFASKGPRALRLLDLTHDFGIPIVAAVGWNGRTFSRPKLGLGIEFDQQSAVAKALGELVTQIVTSPAHENDGDVGIGPCPPDHVIGRKAAGPPTRIPSHFEAMSTGQRLVSVLEMLRDRNLTCIVLDQSCDEESTISVRVVVQGLRSLAARFGPGRLFDISESNVKDENGMIKFGTISKNFYGSCCDLM